MSSTRRGGFSLMEVLLATAILMGSVVVLGELVRIGLRNAQLARSETQAQLLCESRLSEMLTGSQPLESVEGVLLEEAPGWLCDVELNETTAAGLTSVSVTVRQELPEEKRPASFTLVRWLRESPAPADESTPDATAAPDPGQSAWHSLPREPSP